MPRWARGRAGAADATARVRDGGQRAYVGSSQGKAEPWGRWRQRARCVRGEVSEKLGATLAGPKDGGSELERGQSRIAVMAAFQRSCCIIRVDVRLGLCGRTVLWWSWGRALVPRRLARERGRVRGFDDAKTCSVANGAGRVAQAMAPRGSKRAGGAWTCCAWVCQAGRRWCRLPVKASAKISRGQVETRPWRSCACSGRMRWSCPSVSSTSALVALGRTVAVGGH